MAKVQEVAVLSGAKTFGRATRALLAQKRKQEMHRFRLQAKTCGQRLHAEDCFPSSFLNFCDIAIDGLPTETSRLLRPAAKLAALNGFYRQHVVICSHCPMRRSQKSRLKGCLEFGNPDRAPHVASLPHCQRAMAPHFAKKTNRDAMAGTHEQRQKWQTARLREASATCCRIIRARSARPFLESVECPLKCDVLVTHCSDLAEEMRGQAPQVSS